MCILLQDAWSDSEGHVSLDSQQDYELIEAKRRADGFYLIFKRPFGTCDPRDYLIEVGKVLIQKHVCQICALQIVNLSFFGLVNSVLNAIY